jgi:hypothetical protein
MVPDKADHVPERWVGLPIRRRRSDPRRGLTLHIRRQLAAVDELVKANSVTVERLHRCGANTVIACWGAISIGEGARGRGER